MKDLETQDQAIFSWIAKEKAREHEHIELIASENYVSQAVLETTGSILTNKYAEGYPGRRYYGGCEFVDEIETLAIERVKRLYGAEYANVQPHSGSQANMVVYFAFLKPGDKILAMDLAHGGHLTHGSTVNFSGKLYEIHSYGVDAKTEMIDYDVVLKRAQEVKPKMIVAGASSYSRTIDFKRFREIADAVGAILLVDMAHIAGLVAKGLHSSPVPYAHVVTSTTHKTLRGPRGGLILVGKNIENPLNIQKNGKTMTMGELLDFTLFPGSQGGPLMHVIGAKAVAFQEALDPLFEKYQTQIIKNTRALSDCFLKAGMHVISGGTDNHLLTVNVAPLGWTGLEMQVRLEKAYMTTNKNMIPFDKNSPIHASGIRIGAAALTTRGFKEKEMELLANWMMDLMKDRGESLIDDVKKKVLELTKQYPLFNEEWAI